MRGENLDHLAKTGDAAPVVYEKGNVGVILQGTMMMINYRLHFVRIAIY